VVRRGSAAGYTGELEEEGDKINSIKNKINKRISKPKLTQ
jgi:hypothetical protein